MSIIQSQLTPASEYESGDFVPALQGASRILHKTSKLPPGFGVLQRELQL